MGYFRVLGKSGSQSYQLLMFFSLGRLIMAESVYIEHIPCLYHEIDILTRRSPYVKIRKPFTNFRKIVFFDYFPYDSCEICVKVYVFILMIQLTAVSDRFLPWISYFRVLGKKKNSEFSDSIEGVERALRLKGYYFRRFSSRS